MSAYKVIYRNAHPDWQEGCPIKIEAIQVSRNTESGACFLQTKLTNISNADVHVIEFDVVLSNDEGDSETVVFKLLDADLPAGKTITPEAKRLSLSEVTDSAASITRVDEQKSFAAGIQIMDPEPVELSKELLEERNELLKEQNAIPELCSGIHCRHKEWWQCGCGAINLHRDICWNCQAPLEVLDRASSQAFLKKSSLRRLYKLATEKLSSVKQTDSVQALSIFEKLSEENYKDSAEKVHASKKRISELKKSTQKKRIALVAAVVSIALLAVCINTIIIPFQKREAKNAAVYQDASEQMEGMHYDKAIKKFESLGDYSDSSSKAKEASRLKKQHPFSAKVGSTVEFGHFTQDQDGFSKGDPIKWTILEKEKNEALVITSSIIDHRPYNSNPSKSVDYSMSDLSDYLNGNFKTSAFTKSERRLIRSNILILKSDQYDEYSSHDSYATPEGECWWTSSKRLNSYWANWGYGDGNDLLEVVTTGSIRYCEQDNEAVGVRPAMWVTI